MIYDASLLLSDQQAITASAASTNSYDAGATGTPYGATNPVARDLGHGAEIPVAVNVVATFNNLTSLSVAWQTADDAGFTTNVETVETGMAVPAASLVAGYQFRVPWTIPHGMRRRFNRLFYTVVGTAPTTGKITAGVVAARQTNFVGGQ
ncbi:Bbp16 family capsid cement protein [Novosphingobium rosa]|uniref:Bbp16 family capsid cement protein n=1 Tax=Novosphingobium rosa TaxID=76978 RepID=UPI00082FA360|nr:hypothetical protein [Novosphingobium rosa]